MTDLTGKRVGARSPVPELRESIEQARAELQAFTANVTEAGESLLTAPDAAAQRTALNAASRYVSPAAMAGTRTLMLKLRRGVADAQLLVIGDSTGNEQTEWVYLLGQHLATKFPAYTVTYRLWDAATQTAYGSPVTIQTGTGAKTLAIYNASYPGSTPEYVRGSRWDAAVAATAPDLILVNHGHNVGSSGTAQTVFDMFVSTYVAPLLFELADTHPGVPVTCLTQNPSGIAGRETWQGLRASTLDRLAQIVGLGIIDTHQAFLDYGPTWKADLMADDIHPNGAGQALWASVVNAAFTEADTASVPPALVAPYIQQGWNLAANPKFTEWAGTNPDSWNTFNLCAPAKELTIKETGTQAMKLTADATAGFAWAELSMSITDRLYLRGRYVTVAARVYVPASNTSIVRLQSYDDGGSANAKGVDVGTILRDRWVWVFTAHKVAPTSNTMRLRISPRTSGTQLAEVIVDRVWIGEGLLPMVAGI